MKPQQLKAIATRAALEQINKEKEAIRVRTSSAMMAATLLTLHDKYDWTPDRLQVIMVQIFNQFDAVVDKFVKIDDFYKCLEEMGIKVEGWS
jgi:hypothetical protein